MSSLFPLPGAPRGTCGSKNAVSRRRPPPSTRSPRPSEHRSEPRAARSALAATMDHPRWEAVAERCLACGNCTAVCPACFCTDVDDVSDLHGGVERHRSWASCFDLAHSYLHGGAVRASIASRYRQWATHKLSSWHDQFATAGCVGCGRCITWCPAGIDLIAEVAKVGTQRAAADERPADRGGQP